MIMTHILIASDADYALIRGLRKGKYNTPWMVPKIASPGDNAIIFHHGAGFVATAEIMTSPKRAMFRNQKRYKADIQANNISPVAFTTIIKKVPNWKWTNYPKGYTTIEGDIEKRVWDLIGNQGSSKPHAAVAYLFLWNPKKDPASFKDYDQIQKNAASGRSYTTRWICPSIKPRAGDLAIVQRTGTTNNGVFALGHVTHAPFYHNGNRLVGLKLDSFLPIGSEIARKEIVETANYKKNWAPMASGNIIPDELLHAIRSLWPERGKKPQPSGGGFGSPAENKKVEAAAMRFVSRWYRAKGWKVSDVSAQCLGYDLHCVRGRQIFHIEVKGSSGLDHQFIITANEMATWKVDPLFVLTLVTNIKKKPEMHQFVGVRAMKSLRFTALSYMAVAINP